jgi:aspartate carbamoyltransferase regulatory subunit
MDSLKALEVRRVSLSEDLSRPGDYVYIEKRAPRIQIERTPLTAPAGILEKLWWKFFGKKYELKQIVELVWPDYDAIILNCPECNSPCATTKRHKIVSIEPLALEIPLTCPYCKTKSFTITEGKLMPA